MATKDTDPQPKPKKNVKRGRDMECENDTEIIQLIETEGQEMGGQEEEEGEDAARLVRKEARREKIERKRLRMESENDMILKVEADEKLMESQAEEEEEEEERLTRIIKKEVRREKWERKRLRAESEITVKSEKEYQGMEVDEEKGEEELAGKIRKKARINRSAKKRESFCGWNRAKEKGY
jgi:hypothetical protein